MDNCTNKYMEGTKGKGHVDIYSGDIQGLTSHVILKVLKIATGRCFSICSPPTPPKSYNLIQKQNLARSHFTAQDASGYAQCHRTPHNAPSLQNVPHVQLIKKNTFKNKCLPNL